MTVVGARIDNRLLHGIVATSWLPQSGATRVMVIDDKVANDPQMKEAMKLGRPSGLAVSIITKEKALNNFKNNKYDRQKVFILSKTPDIFLDLINEGVDIPKLVLGGTMTYDNAKKITNRAYVKNKEISIYKRIRDAGIPVVSMYTTNDDEVNVMNFLNEGV
ncbi:PTS sugar transporter subunit IIB [Tetragenococcus koreensis]|uniref:PTS system mannose/fructose/N-acetylgalactosamine-transporter subunit IIB n=1 Tax=Tetragenococcus koreensis TaxID=290335 RepID=UPI001F3172F9|nr:PTS sugar transporter subunit IIB [Tetragenococcus koreensis]MCF1615221.1 PTS sugar transporter subunit IIB [Tetragenococcus koreensis]MCF1625023.1 PTS sugar transporter subunit IIB [Tetragenococcus koreensis]MCF1627741.1 PTS sugar transporter subunit IIB [Tetragenococcus koreensis]MCF1678175.1 PTS sugar transporter subunit IIB [Tetragenococcus koreensis]MDN6255991.1 PTS sugar transporter subunit IIB [Tetragenococcus koreensis]